MNQIAHTSELYTRLYLVLDYLHGILGLPPQYTWTIYLLSHENNTQHLKPFLLQSFIKRNHQTLIHGKANRGHRDDSNRRRTYSAVQTLHALLSDDLFQHLNRGSTTRTARGEPPRNRLHRERERLSRETRDGGADHHGARADFCFCFFTVLPFPQTHCAPFFQQIENPIRQRGFRGDAEQSGRYASVQSFYSFRFYHQPRRRE